MLWYYGLMDLCYGLYELNKYSGGHSSNMEKYGLRENGLLNAECQEIPSSALSVKATYWRLIRPIIEKPTSQGTINRFLGTFT